MSRFIKAPVTIPTHYYYQIHQWYTTSNNDVYIPFGASQTEGTSTAAAVYDDTYWITPFAGKLIKAYLFTAQTADTCDLQLRVDGSLGSSMLSGGTVEVSSGTVATFTCDQNNTFTTGQYINLFILNETAPRQATMTTVWEID